MQNNGNGNKIMMWVIGGLVFIAMAFSGYSLSRTDDHSKALAAIPEKYVSKEDFREALKAVNDKLDKLLDMHMKDE